MDWFIRSHVESLICLIFHFSFFGPFVLSYNYFVFAGFIPDVDDCDPSPCENNATCTDLHLDYRCDCAPGYEGRNCSEGMHSLIGFLPLYQ